MQCAYLLHIPFLNVKVSVRMCFVGCKTVPAPFEYASVIFTLRAGKSL